MWTDLPDDQDAAPARALERGRVVCVAGDGPGLGTRGRNRPTAYGCLQIGRNTGLFTALGRPDPLRQLPPSWNKPDPYNIRSSAVVPPAWRTGP
jgi:hypothetical protein